MTESEANQNKRPPLKKGELHVESTPDTVFVPGVGFMPAPEKVSVSVGDEEKILEGLRSHGFSEKAIAAFKSGKVIKMIYQNTPFGVNIISETWKGNEEKKEDSV